MISLITTQRGSPATLQISFMRNIIVHVETNRPDDVVISGNMLLIYAVD